MKQIPVQFSWIDPQAAVDLPLPSYSTILAAGMDVAAAIDRPRVIAPGEIVLLPTGFRIAIPDGYEVQVRPRSGLAVKHGLTIINSPGTIDADYRGEVKIGLINLGQTSYTVQRGDRIAQLVLAPVVQSHLVLVDDLDETERGAGGFGHSGI